jgi:hypothetical protein
MRSRRMEYAAVAMAVAIGAALPGRGRAVLPNDARGFSGQVRGIVASKGARSSIQFLVSGVVHLGNDNKADKPQSLVGQTVAVWPRWEQKDGLWLQSPLHVAFIHTLKDGQEITLGIRNAEMSHFEVISLSEEQIKTAKSVSKEELEKAGGKPKGRVTKARVDGLEVDIKQLQEKVRKLREELDRRKK